MRKNIEHRIESNLPDPISRQNRKMKTNFKTPSERQEAEKQYTYMPCLCVVQSLRSKISQTNRKQVRTEKMGRQYCRNIGRGGVWVGVKIMRR